MEKTRNVVLHVGPHKTGTSFLQQEIFNKINEANFIRSKIITDLHIEVRRLNIISHEGFSSLAPYHDILCDQEEVLDHLKRLFPEAKVIVGLRNMDSWLRSCYKQYVFGGRCGTLDYDRYKQKYHKNLPSHSDYVNEIKKRWDDVFVYHQETLNDEIEPMCRFMGCEVPVYSKKRVHFGLNKSELFIWRQINKILPKTIMGKLRYFVSKIRGRTYYR